MGQVVEYNITDAAIHQMESQYMGYTIAGIDDKAGFDMVHEARMVVKGKRIEVEKRRKELKADALAWGRKVDSEAKKIFAKLQPIEDHLQSEEQRVLDEKQRIKEEEERREKERIQARIDELLRHECSVPFFEVAAMTDEEYEKVLFNAKETYKVQQAIRADEERQRQEKEEADRKAREQEEKRLAQERLRLKQIREEQEAEAAKIKAEQQRIAEERRSIEEEKRLEEAKKAAAETALREAERKKEIEAEAAMKKEALKPDKEKLLGWIKTIHNLPDPALNTLEAKHIYQTMIGTLNETLESMENWIKKQL